MFFSNVRRNRAPEKLLSPKYVRGKQYGIKMNLVHEFIPLKQSWHEAVYYFRNMFTATVPKGNFR